MGQVSSKLRRSEHGYSYWCQGCEEAHRVTVDPGWGFNGNLEKPTFTPSVLVTCGHYAPGFETGKGCWCTYNAAKIAACEEPSGFECSCCHTHITDGMVQFLGDCTHALAGQTLPLPDLPEHMTDA